MMHRDPALARVLLVDDDAHLVAGLRERLRAQYDVATATSGAAALDLLRLAQPGFDVVVADMRMPGMSGLDLLRAVRAEFPGTARVMLTGDESSATARTAINDGAVTRLLAKPCQAVDLVMAIDAALAQAATERIAMQAVETSVVQRSQANLVLALGLQLGSPMAGVRAAIDGLRQRAEVEGLSQELTALDRQARRFGAMFDRFLELLQTLGDPDDAGAGCHAPEGCAVTDRS